MRLGLFSWLFAAILCVAAPVQAGCGDPLPGPGSPVVVRDRITEGERQSLSAAVFLALSDLDARTDWPWREIEAAAPCVVSTFEVDGVEWRVSGGDGSAPLRWARATGVDEYYFLVAGPSPAEAADWARTRRLGAAPAGRSATYLVGFTEALMFVLNIYDGAPDARRLATDLTDAIKGKTLPIAMFDAGGQAVTVIRDLDSGRTGELFRPGLINGERYATLLGPDGTFFTPVGGGVRLRGSELLCGDVYGPFSRGHLMVISTRDETLDLGCSIHADGSWMTVFTTRIPDARGDAAEFRSKLRATQAELGVSGKAVRSRPDRNGLLRAGAAWVDRQGRGQGVWFMRRGEYVVEVRATFHPDDTDAVYAVLAALLRNEIPPPPARDDEDLG